MEKAPALGIAGKLTPTLQKAWDEQIRNIEQATSKEALAETCYIATCWLGALVQGRVIAANSATSLRDERDKARERAEQRIHANQQ
jgi:hypothetical protein